MCWLEEVMMAVGLPLLRLGPEDCHFVTSFECLALGKGGATRSSMWLALQWPAKLCRIHSTVLVPNYAEMDDSTTCHGTASGDAD